MSRHNRFGSLAVACAMLLAAGGVAAQTVGVAASNPGSLYHSTGSALAKLMSEQAGVPATVQPFASATIYLPAVNAGEYQFGITNEDEARLAVTGAGHFAGRPGADLRAVSILYPLRLGFFVRKDSDIKDVSGLKGKRITYGFTSQKTIPPIIAATLEIAGLSESDIKPVMVPNVVGGANAFIAGKADAFIFALGAAKVAEANASAGGIRLLGFGDTAENLAVVRKHFPPAYIKQEAAHARNIGVTAPTNAIAYDVLLMSNAQTDEDTVYKVAKAMHGNKKAMAASFGVLNLFQPDRMNKPLGPIQWHPGAIRFYKETGAWRGE
ncbi:MAG: TAXI family TRAP transporter solute-binding subunit [Burkholderiales bacterium]|nr:MAG: TAXI family TRAP transporter solute-binding subunit [Burkholderiales bacterium]